MFHRNTFRQWKTAGLGVCLLLAAASMPGESFAASPDAEPGDIAPETDFGERRERAETLRPRLAAMQEEYAAKTFDDGRGPAIPYRLFKPATAEPGKKYPLVVYLHGSGGRGTENQKQISAGNLYGACSWAMPENQAERPCFVLAPQLEDSVASGREMAVQGEKVSGGESGSPVAGTWELTVGAPARRMAMGLVISSQDGTLGGSLRIPRRGTLTLSGVAFDGGALSFCTTGGMSLQGKLTIEGRTLTGTLSSAGNREQAGRLADLIRTLVEQLDVDQRRIYITGQSMGGGGTWGMLAFFPELFAAAVPVCGTGDVDSAPAIVEGGAAVWAFHGEADPTVPVEASRRMIAALRSAGGRPRYTEYPGVKHDSWVDAYTDPALHAWLFQQSRR